jgi:hypothetical protein
MLELLFDNIFVSFGGTLFQQFVRIPMGTNFATLLADLLLYSYESEFLQKLVKDKKIHEARAFNFIALKSKSKDWLARNQENISE